MTFDVKGVPPIMSEATQGNETGDTRSRVAVVTGAGSGIGRSVAQTLLENGYCVALAGRREQRLHETAKQSSANRRAQVVPTDVTDPESVKNLFQATRDAFGRIDVLFNNAGVGAPAVPLEELTLSQWKTVVDTNLTGMFLCIQEAFRAMKAQSPRGGRIINNGSVSATTPRPNSAPYTATKHAVTGLTKSAALDGRPYDIACSQIDIGNAATEMAEKMAQGVPQSNGQTMVEPLMDVDEVGRAVLHMADLPLDVNILYMTIMATKMPLVGRG